MRHPYHLIEPSPQPLLISLNLLFFLIGFVAYMTGYLYSLYSFFISFIMIVFLITLQLYDIITESLTLGFHSFKVSRGLIYGFLLFILTEIMLFFSFFQGYFHSAFNPTELVQPPIGIDLINPQSIPLLNTFLLLYSGISATQGHHSFIAKNRNSTLLSLGIGIILGLIFVLLQGFEYYNSPFDISDSSYSSTFFMLTGLHGFHVIVGVGFLLVTQIRIAFYHRPHVLFDLSMLYYHLVDLIQILLFILIYYMAY